MWIHLGVGGRWLVQVVVDVGVHGGEVGVAQNLPFLVVADVDGPLYALRISWGRFHRQHVVVVSFRVGGRRWVEVYPGPAQGPHGAVVRGPGPQGHRAHHNGQVHRQVVGSGDLEGDPDGVLYVDEAAVGDGGGHGRDLEQLGVPVGRAARLDGHPRDNGELAVPRPGLATRQERLRLVQGGVGNHRAARQVLEVGGDGD
uniref:Putative secreted protein n=1 Tax=Ixodes ricinus TaxID=34613 RepID=A0A6B0V2G9_IXORI